MAWTKVHPREDRFWVERGEFFLTEFARKVYYCESDAVIVAADALTASANSVTVDAHDGSYSAGYAGCRVFKRECELLTPFQAKVTVDFKSRLSALELVALPAKYASKPAFQMVEYPRDRSDPPKWVRTTAGEPFAKGPERKDGVVIYSLRKYVNSSTKATIEAATYTTNSSSVTIRGRSWGAEEVLLDDHDFADVDETPGVYLATITLAAKAGGWIDRAANAGFSELVGGKLRQIMQWDAAGKVNVPTQKPWPLNSDGTRKLYATDEIDELEFRPYTKASWSGVPLT